ncbi:MAG: FlgD immunoglobulin-like domain containing protein, partial [Bacteroidota bacterium]
GRLYMYEVFGNERWVEYQTRVYCILGDPSVHVWRNVPRPVRAAYPSSIPVGYNQVAFTVTDSATGAPVEAAQICLAGDSVYATAYTDRQGRVIVPVTPEMVDTLTVLVRGGNVVPYEGTMRITTETEHVAPFGQPVVVDLDGNLDGMINPNEHGQITFTLKNWGTQTASNVQATLSVDTSMVQLQTTSPVDFGNLPPGGSFVGSPFQFFVKPNCAVGDTMPFSLHVTSTTRTWDYIQLEDVKGSKLKCVMYVVDDRSSVRANARMDPGETVKLYITVRNVGEDVAPNVQTTLRCTSSYITVSDSSSTFGTIRADSSFTNYGDYFVVRVDSQCPARSIIPYSLLLQTQGGRYAYRYVDTFSISVSIPRRSDPTGPDSYGYYAYASDDTFYQQAPRYSWTEINGIGTQITGASGNFTSTVTLPFTFKYYGMNYTQVRLSSDGWIAFGSGTQTAINNYCLPRNDNVNCMVAAFWLNLFATSGETGKLLYYSDVPRHRFIVEWYDVGHYSDRTKKETFQIILHDPAYYPTPTGDGEILMQYKNTADPGENTVGIENNTQTIALQYVCGDQPDYDESITPLRDTLAILFTTRTPQLLVGVDDRRIDRGVAPTEFVLEQNYPNPFNPQTIISYSLPASSHVSLRIYSVTGQLVRTLYDGDDVVGRHAVLWDGMNDRGNSVGSGVYFYRLGAAPRSGTFKGFVQTKKLLLLR